MVPQARPQPRTSPAPSTTPAVVVRDVSKRFRVYHRRPAGLKERLLAVVLRRQVEFYEELWAVRGVSLEVGAGETLGLIGPNGSGKSTLLQIIAGIYSPDRGAVRVRGRLRALLELGAGFNPELSGRENVLLNGQLLGFRKQEIKRRFNTIVDFAEIERFIDMPLKTYSSGMQMRLAFAIATHLDPEVLLLDEILAVGDDHFQRKCLKRIYEIRESGAAILFISHDLNTVERLCDRVGLLMKGSLVDVGEPADIVGRYQALLAAEHRPAAPAPPSQQASLEPDVATATPAEPPVPPQPPERFR
ncbi:MAG: ABC transporter ATP-binding protein [Acidobacteria bacterium]|nr:ABC transporter ATP-binding protein [Acidobacteriota bacterium]